MLDTWMAKSRRLRIVASRSAAVAYRFGVTANRATVLAALAGGLSALALAGGYDGAGLAALWLSAAFDALDGVIARNCQRPTALGGVIDLVSDRWVEAAALVGIVWHRPGLSFAALVVVASWYVNITVFLAVGTGLGAGEKLIQYPPGVLERGEAFIFLTLLVLIGNGGVYLCYIYAAAEVLTAIQRLNFARRHLR
jgi:archaetidylinositol phosphate synthase